METEREGTKTKEVESGTERVRYGDNSERYWKREGENKTGRRRDETGSGDQDRRDGVQTR